MLVLVSAVTRQNWYFPATPNFFPSQLRQIQFEDNVREEIGVRQRENTLQICKKRANLSISAVEEIFCGNNFLDNKAIS